MEKIRHSFGDPLLPLPPWERWAPARLLNNAQSCCKSIGRLKTGRGQNFADIPTQRNDGTNNIVEPVNLLTSERWPDLAKATDQSRSHRTTTRLRPRGTDPARCDRRK